MTTSTPPRTVFVIGDMEGVSGVTKWEETEGGTPLHQSRSILYTEEINAAVRGAAAAGAREIVVMDCHGAGGGWTFNSLIPELLDPRCDLVVQDHWTEYTKLLEDGCDAALLIGQHARAGTRRGVLNHTVAGTSWRSVAFNGQIVGEVGITAALCGTWGCPVVLVTGDAAVCEESRALLGEGLTIAPVKQGIGRYSARHIAPVRAREMIEQAATTALESRASIAPYDPGRPCEIRVELALSSDTERWQDVPGIDVPDERTLISRGEEWWSAWRQFFFFFQF